MGERRYSSNVVRRTLYGSTSGGPTVTWGDWGVSVTTGHGPGAELNVYRFTPSGKLIKGEAYGKRFATQREAWDYALSHGYIQRYRRRMTKVARTR